MTTIIQLLGKIHQKIETIKENQHIFLKTSSFTKLTHGSSESNLLNLAKNLVKYLRTTGIYEKLQFAYSYKASIK